MSKRPEPEWDDDPRDTPAMPVPHGRCTATAKGSGVQCKRRPIVGGSVCKMHGGGAPQVIAAADRRVAIASAASLLAHLGLLRDQDPAAALLEEVHRASNMVLVYEEAIRRVAREHGEEADLDALYWGRSESKERVVDGVSVTEEKWIAGAHVLIQEWRKERKHLSEVSALAVRANLEAQGPQQTTVVVSFPQANPGGQPEVLVVDGGGAT